MNLHLTILLLYSAVLIGVGLWIGRRVTQTSAFFVAGRSLGPVLMFATVLAANIGAGSTVGAAGFGFRDGLSAWWWVGSAAVGTLVLALWVGPRIRKMARERGYYTAGDFLEDRYGVRARLVIAALLWVGTLAILAGQLIALAFVLRVVVGLPHWAGVVIGGVVMTTYFAAGGLAGAAWINLIQLAVLLTTFLVAIPLVMIQVGGWEGLVRAPVPEFANPLAGEGRSGWIFLPLLAPAFVVSPGLLQKVYAARDDRAVRLGVGLSALVLFLFAFAPAILGMAARVLHPDIPTADRELALPTLLMYDLPVFVGAIGLGALFMADVSSADAILFMLSTSLSQDFYRRFVNPRASDADILRVARWAAVAGGAAGIGLALVTETVADALTIFYTLIGVILFVPVVVGLYTGRAGAPEAFASFGLGIAVTLAVRVTFGGTGVGFLTPNVAGLAAAAISFLLVWLVRSRSRPQPV